MEKAYRATLVSWGGEHYRGPKTKIISVIVSQTLLSRMGLEAILGYVPERAQLLSLGCHRAHFLILPQGTTRNPGHSHDVAIFLKQQPHCRVISFNFCATQTVRWLPALWFCFIAPLDMVTPSPGQDLVQSVSVAWHAGYWRNTAPFFSRPMAGIAISIPLRYGCSDSRTQANFSF